MSDQSLSRDELASALLDGEVEEPTAVDPAIASRMEQLRQAAEAIAVPVPVDDAAKERAITAALAEFDALGQSEATSGTGEATVSSLRHRTRWMPVLAGAAAVVAVLAGAAAVLQRDDTKSNETAASAAATVAAASGAPLDAATTTIALSGGGVSDRNAAAGDAAAEAASPPNAPAPLIGDLGEISDDDQLRAALPKMFASTATNPGSDACEAPARASTGEQLGTFAGSVTLRFEEQPARALVFVDEQGADHIVVVADPTCEVLDRID